MKKIFLQYISLLSIVLFFSIVLVATAKEKPKESFEGYKYNIHTHPLVIDVMKNIHYPGSEIVIEQELPHGKNYYRYIASYISQGHKVYALLTVPQSRTTQARIPVVVMAHGYIPPNEYTTGEYYPELIDALSSRGFIIFAPDFRGHGKSEGVAEGAYFSATYTEDFLNALASIKRYKKVNSHKIGAWGHSMGGNIVLRSLVVDQEFKSAAIWAGVVGSYSDILFHWNNQSAWKTSVDQKIAKPEHLQKQFGSINENSEFWNKISPVSYLDQVNIPLQLSHSVEDSIVPIEFSRKLKSNLEKVTEVELYEYPGDDHELKNERNIDSVYNTVSFFERTLK